LINFLGQRPTATPTLATNTIATEHTMTAGRVEESTSFQLKNFLFYSHVGRNTIQSCWRPTWLLSSRFTMSHFFVSHLFLFFLASGNLYSMAL